MNKTRLKYAALALCGILCGWTMSAVQQGRLPVSAEEADRQQGIEVVIDRNTRSWGPPVWTVHHGLGDRIVEVTAHEVAFGRPVQLGYFALDEDNVAIQANTLPPESGWHLRIRPATIRRGWNRLK